MFGIIDVQLFTGFGKEIEGLRVEKMVDVSIIIVNWNTKDLLLNCLKSIENTEAKYQMEIIVVDNASSDGSQEAVQRLFPDVKLIFNESNLGFAKANNIGINESTGKYVCLLNSDIVVRSGCFDRMFKYMEQNPSIGVLGPKLLNPDFTLQWSCKRFPTLWNNFCLAVGLNSLFPRSKIFVGEHMTYFSHDSTRKVDALVGAFLMVRRAALNVVGLLDEEFFIYGEEIDWCKRFWCAGWEVTFSPEAEAIHFGAGSSSKEPERFYIELYRSKLNFWKKHRTLYAQIGFRAIAVLRQVFRIIVHVLLCVIGRSQREKIISNIKSSLAVLCWLLKPSKTKLHKY